MRISKLSKITGLFFQFLCILTLVNAVDNNETDIAGEKITYGTPARHRPYQVQLLAYRQFYCSGAILNSKWVLTAAHCVYGMSKNSIEVLAGSRYRLARGDRYYQLRSIEKILMHRNFAKSSWLLYPNDIALIKVAGKFSFDKANVQPIDIATSIPPVNAIVSITGWGRNEWGSLTSVLQETNMRVVNWNSCRYEWTFGLNPGQLCTKPHSRRNAATCNGDSGGPLVYGDTVVGIVSFGTLQCPSWKSDVFTNVAHYQNWIFNVMKKF